jgi:hypothetical protein
MACIREVSAQYWRLLLHTFRTPPTHVSPLAPSLGEKGEVGGAAPYSAPSSLPFRHSPISDFVRPIAPSIAGGLGRPHSVTPKHHCRPRPRTPRAAGARAGPFFTHCDPEAPHLRHLLTQRSRAHTTQRNSHRRPASADIFQRRGSTPRCWCARTSSLRAPRCTTASLSTGKGTAHASQRTARPRHSGYVLHLRACAAARIRLARPEDKTGCPHPRSGVCSSPHASGRTCALAPTLNPNTHLRGRSHARPELDALTLPLLLHGIARTARQCHAGLDFPFAPC